MVKRTVSAPAPASMYGRRYPWEKWFSRERFTLRKGKDFNGRAYTMAQQVRNAAGPERHNVKVSIQVSEEGDCIEVTVLERDGESVRTSQVEEARRLRRSAAAAEGGE